MYNISGQLVTILTNGYYNPGSYSINYSSEDLLSGLYFLRLASSNFTTTEKIVLAY